ncbi:MAG TPA: hypothetical protein VLX29_00780 [Nitrospirota bacterium]|nr:hypothetical protein [Nitrospirota bacterium]
MRYFIFLPVFLLFTASTFAADDAVTHAMKLYEKRHYEEAIVVLRSELPALKPAQQGAVHLALGMIYLKKAQLYRAFYQESLAASQDYLKKLSAIQGRGSSRYADLYMGLTLVEAGKSSIAAAFMEKFIANDSLDSLTREISKVNLGLCYYFNNEKERAENLWRSIDSSNPEVRCALASAYSKAGLKDKNPVVLCDQSIADAKQTGKTISTRLARNMVSVYARARLTDRGLDALKRADVKKYSYQETLGKSKIINFYDVSILGDMASLFSQSCIAYLEKAVADATVKDAGEYYLSEAYSLFGNAYQSAKVAASFISSSRMSQPYKDRIRVWQASNDYEMGRKIDAMGVLNDLSQKQQTNPDFLGEILFACVRTKADCGTISKRAALLAESGQGRKYYVLNFALGKYSLMKKNPGMAISYMEAGRDKSNKNKIESNDPLMLVDLAGLYYRSKKFSEALEIYFEMSKQFPEVRQIQETMQGVYAMEQKSAGDVKIY